MNKTLEYILSLIAAAVPQFSNSSITAIWYKMATVFASTCDLIIAEFNNTLDIITNTVKNNRFGTSNYYTNSALNFQFGYNLYIGNYKGGYNASTNTPFLENGTGNAGDYYLVEVAGERNFGNGVITCNVGDTIVYFGSNNQYVNQPVGVVNNFQPYYEVIDTDAQIVKQAAFIERLFTVNDPMGNEYTKSEISLNVATTDTNGFLIPLSNIQLTSFLAYMQYFQIPGLPLKIYSVNGNEIRFLNMNCYYKSTYSLEQVQEEVFNAFISYLKITTLGSLFRTNALELYIVNNTKNVGVIDMSLYNAQILINGEWIGFQDVVTMPSGYFNYVPNFELNINYIAQNV